MRRVWLLLALPLALVACGGSKHTAGTTTAPTTTTPILPVGSGPVPQAVAKTDNSAFHMTFAGTIKTSGESVRLGGNGDFDVAGGRGTLDARVPAGAKQVPLNEVLDGQTVYVSSPLVSGFLPRGKKWVKVTLASAAQSFGFSTFALTSPGLVPALTGVRKVGKATLNGAKTTEYSGKVDRSRLPATTRAALASGRVRFSRVDVWIGSDGYVHRTRITTSSSTRGAHGSAVVTTTLSQFGKTVFVTLPSAAETVDVTKAHLPRLGGKGA